MQSILKGSLPTIVIDGEVSGYIMDGEKYGASASAIIVDVAPGCGPVHHTHPYPEIFVIIDGVVRVEVDGEVMDAAPEQICVVPAGAVHKFSNVGPGRARLVNIHAARAVVTEFVGDPRQSGSYSYRHSS